MNNTTENIERPKVLLIGSYSIPEMTQEAFNQVVAFRNAGWDFITKDGNSIYKDFNRVLSTIGVSERSTVYSLGDPLHNNYALPYKTFEAKYSAEEKKCYIIEKDTDNIVKEIDGIEDPSKITKNPEYFSFLDRYLVDKCSAAICMWDGKSKQILNTIMKLNILSKPVYSFVLDL